MSANQTNTTTTKSQRSNAQQLTGQSQTAQSNATSAAPGPGLGAGPRRVAQPLDSAKYDPAEKLQNEDVLVEKTFESEQNPLEVGEHTAELSDVSDGEGEQEKRTAASRNALSTWYRRIQPLVRNRRVRVFAIVNTVLTAINLFLFMAVMIILGFLIYETVSVVRRTSEDSQCIFEWTEWGECSAECATASRLPDGSFGDVILPTRTRRVLVNSIVQTRGRKYPACPPDLATKEDKAPCNTYICPRNLSEFDFTLKYLEVDEYGDAVDVGKGMCSFMRNIPMMDMLIKLDNMHLTTVKPCNTT